MTPPPGRAADRKQRFRQLARRLGVAVDGRCGRCGRLVPAHTTADPDLCAACHNPR